MSKIQFPVPLPVRILTRAAAFVALAGFFLSTSTHAAADPVQEEAMYRDFYRALTEPGAQVVDPESLSALEARLALDAAEDALVENLLAVDIGTWISQRALGSLPPREQLRWFRLRALQNRDSISTAEEAKLAASFAAHIPTAATDIELQLELIRSEPHWRTAEGAALVRAAEAANAEAAAEYRATVGGAFAPPSEEVVSDLFRELPDLGSFQGGSYRGTPRLFMFCRHDRRYPCLLAMRDRNDEPVRRADGSLWTQPALALSVVGLPFNQRNGYTPQGVFRVDSVMPAADRQEFFGKFRRLILNFVGRTQNEAELKRALPRSSESEAWWRESVVSRDIGRGLFRIHGTGQINRDPESSYYPLYPTHGCIAQRENRYGSTEYVDQRRLLDRWMEAAGREPTYANETAIRGLLYLIEIDDARAPVRAADLERFGIR